MTKYFGLTPEQVEFVRNNYSNHGSLYCAEYLNVSQIHVRKTASKIGIKLNYEVWKECTKKRIKLAYQDETKRMNNKQAQQDRFTIYTQKDKIIDLYINQKKSMSEIKRILNLQTYSAIRNILNDAHIKIEPKGHNARLWTENDDNFIRKYYYNTEKDIIIKSLNRTWNQVIKRAKNLNIKRDLNFFRTRETIKFNYRDNPMKRPDVRKKQSERMLKFIQDHPDKMLNKMLKRNKITSLEKRVKRILDKHNIIYQYNNYVKTVNGYKFPDFRIGKLIIECDGKNFHLDKIKETERDRELINSGYNILHFHEDTINKNIQKVERCILSKLKELNISV